MGQTSPQTLVRHWRSIQLISFIVAVVSFLVAVACGQYFLASAPMHPKQESGRTIRYQEHQKVVYITIPEQLIQDFFVLTAFIGAGLFGCTVVYKKIRPKQTTDKSDHKEAP